MSAPQRQQQQQQTRSRPGDQSPIRKQRVGSNGEASTVMDSPPRDASAWHDRSSPLRTSDRSRQQQRTPTTPKTIITIEAAMAAVAEAEQRKARRKQRLEAEGLSSDDLELNESSVSSPNPSKSLPQHPFPVESPTQSSSTVPDAAIVQSSLPLDTSVPAAAPGPREYKIDWRRMWESTRSRSSEPSSTTTPVTYRYTKGPVRVKRKKVVRFTDGSVVEDDGAMAQREQSDIRLAFDDIEEQLYQSPNRHGDHEVATSSSAEIRIKEIRVKRSPDRANGASSSPTYKMHVGQVESARMRWVGMAVVAVIAIIIGASCGIASCRGPSSSLASRPTPNDTKPRIPTLTPSQTINLFENTANQSATSQTGMGSGYRARSIAIHGDTMVVGVPSVEDTKPGMFMSGTSQGAAFIYQRSSDSSDWVWHSTLRPPSLAETAMAIPCTFGSSVSIWNDVIVVGTESDEANLVAPIFVYERNKRGRGNWTLSAQLLKGVQSSGGNQRTVSIHETTIVVGSSVRSENETESSEANIVYVFDKNAETGAWAESSLASGNDNDAFGFSIAVFGNYLVVGAPGIDSSAGSAHVYMRVEGSPSSWVKMAVLESSDPVGWDQFGFSVAICNITIVIGAPSRVRPGSAYVYSYQGEGESGTPMDDADTYGNATSSQGEWIEVTKLSAADDNHTFAGIQSFGSNVQIWDDTVVVGAAPIGGNETVGLLVCACGYVFTRSVGNEGDWAEGIQLVREGENSTSYGGQSGPIAISVDTIIMGPAGVESAPANSDEGMIYVYEGY